MSNAGSGDVSADTVFRHRQTGEVVTAICQGGSIVMGHLDMRYHHLNAKVTGVGHTVVLASILRSCNRGRRGRAGVQGPGGARSAASATFLIEASRTSTM